MACELDQHYWAEAEQAEQLKLELLEAHDDDSNKGLARRQAIATELLAIEVHLVAHLLEATGLGLGHRVVH